MREEHLEFRSFAFLCFLGFELLPEVLFFLILLMFLGVGFI